MHPLIALQGANLQGQLTAQAARATTGGDEAATRTQRDISLRPHFAVACIYIAYAVLFFPRDYGALVFASVLQLTGLSVTLTAFLIYLAARRQSPDAPYAAFTGIVRSRAPVLLFGILAFVLGLTAFTAYKVNIPKLVPFYADPVLAWIDRKLHGGNAWDWAYSVPRQFATAVDFFYGRVWAVALIVTYLGALSLMTLRELSRYLWTVLFIYIGLGGVMALLASSVGPIFYTEFYTPAYDFAEQRDAIFANPYLGKMHVYTGYLLENYRSGGPAFGTGISAFPSVHVAVATLTAWVLTSHGRVGAVFGWAFYAIIEFGSIYTGWHYGIGGYFSTIAVSLFWIAMSRRYGLPLLGRGSLAATARRPS